jgi:hypothetical protein
MSNENKGLGYFVGRLVGQLTNRGWNFTKVVGIILVIIGFYYLVSPYQNCLRNSHKSAAFCTLKTAW